jgi:hypothetical protein
MSQQQIQSASPEQIAAFKQGAAARYKERGVAPAQADQLFDSHLDKMAKELGVAPAVSPKVQKVAAQLKALLVSTKAAK